MYTQGEMAEWSKATDCKSVSLPHVGSNPTFFILLSYYILNKLYFE